jgi:hypothetical protein
MQQTGTNRYPGLKFFKLFICTLVFIITALSSNISAQSVHTYVDRDSLQVGDRFNYTIVFDGMYDAISFPVEEDFENEFEMISRERYQVTERRDSLVYTLQFFGVENSTIGRKEIQLEYEGSDTTLYTTPVPLFFKTILAEGDEEFRPLKPIFDFARNWWPYILAALLFAIAAYLFYRWYTKREPEPVTEPVPLPDPFRNPLDDLKKEIEKLADVQSLHTEEEFETFYIRLGDSIRLYLKRIYEFPALEMTTREINEELQKELAPSEIITITRKVLNEADIVKFANFHPGTEEAVSVYKRAKQFIETAEVVNYEQIKYMKYRYEVDHGIIKDNTISEISKKENV